jgi:hypothetical protein
MMGLPNYIIITPARNEAKFIECTLTSVIRQTVKPAKWVLVNDGSTDGTDQIISGYASANPWIELLQMPKRGERHFAGKAFAFNAGYQTVAGLRPQIVCNLDADVSVEPDHFEFLLTKYSEDPRLGVWGASFRENGQQYDYRFSNVENVWGGCQLFRTECFEEIGGYKPIKGGSIDHIAVLSARMNGWKTRTFTERICVHHRAMGTAQESELRARFKMGVKDYTVGNHPAWEFARSIYQLSRPPLIVGGVALAAGYIASALKRRERSVSGELAEFNRREQLSRLWAILGKNKRKRGSDTSSPLTRSSPTSNPETPSN